MIHTIFLLSSLILGVIFLYLAIKKSEHLYVSLCILFFVLAIFLFMYGIV